MVFEYNVQSAHIGYSTGSEIPAIFGLRFPRVWVWCSNLAPVPIPHALSRYHGLLMVLNWNKIISKGGRSCEIDHLKMETHVAISQCVPSKAVYGTLFDISCLCNVFPSSHFSPHLALHPQCLCGHFDAHLSYFSLVSAL